MRHGLGWRVAAALAATTAGAAPVAPPQGGTISIQPKTTDGDYDASLTAFADAAAAALAARDFTVLDDTGHAAYVVELLLGREDIGTGLARVPGQRAAAVVGLGVAVPLSTGRSDVVPLRRTRLEMRVRRRGEAAIVWDGAAVTIREASTRTGADGAVATDLVGALLQAYPAQPRTVIGVP